MTEDTIILFGGTLAMAGMAFSLVIFAFFYQKKINKKQHELQRINNLLHATELDATTRFLEGQTKEKNRIAADLHDNIASKIAILKLQLNESQSKSVKSLDHLNVSIDDILKDVRQISHDLSQGMFSGENFKNTLKGYLLSIEKNSQLKISSYFHQLEMLHQDQMGKYLFHILQELIHNTLKYASATAITIEVNIFPDDYVNMLYQDDGIGFDMTVKKDGIGISNIKKRVDLYNGTCFFNSSPGNGVEVNIELPLK